MTKLPNIFGGNEVLLTQSPHGAAQNYKALDTVARPLYTPFDGCKTSRVFGSGQQRYFNLTLPDESYLQCVHGIPIKENHVFNAGEVFGETVKHYTNGIDTSHWHIAINVKGKGWDVVLNYLDRSTQIKLIPGFSSLHWKYWSTWEDLYLNIKDTRMEKLEQAKAWNDAIGEKKYIKENVKITGTGKHSKLMNKVDNTDMEDLLIALSDLATLIGSRSGLKNNIRTDVVLARFAQYAKSTVAI